MRVLGISAKCAEQGGADLLIIYNSGALSGWPGVDRFAASSPMAMPTRSSSDMGKEILTIVEHTPVLAGVNGTDPFLLTDRFLRELIEMGFAGVQNFPTVGLIDGSFRPTWKRRG